VVQVFNGLAGTHKEVSPAALGECLKVEPPNVGSALVHDGDEDIPCQVLLMHLHEEVQSPVGPCCHLPQELDGVTVCLSACCVKSVADLLWRQVDACELLERQSVLIAVNIVGGDAADVSEGSQ